MPKVFESSPLEADAPWLPWNAEEPALGFTESTVIGAAGFSLREFTKVGDATALLASRGLKRAAQVRIILAGLMKHAATSATGGGRYCGGRRRWLEVDAAVRGRTLLSQRRVQECW